MNKEMFREYDIRGIVPKDINPKVAKIIGQSYASYITDKKVIIGMDNRLSSPKIHKALIKGLLKGGAYVIDLGLCTTPMYYVLKKHFDVTNGIMITASHNPKEYNGFKISFSKIGPAYGKAIEDFRDFTFKGEFTKAKGYYEKVENVKGIYLEYIKKSVNFGSRKIKAVFDPGNGTGSVIIEDILKLFPNNIEYQIINGKSDGSFPNHHPDPCEEANMAQLKEKVKNGDFDLGIGIDGDADRVGLIAEDGSFIPVDKILIIVYKALYPTLKEKKAIMDVKCSKALIDEANKINLPITVYRTGNSYMNYKINTDNYDFGGEFSGHLWFRDKWLGIDDGIYAGLRLIEILSNTDKSITDLLKGVTHYYNTPEIKVPCPDEKKIYVIDKVKEYLNQKKIAYNDIDGVRIDFSDGFALIRKSNTTPALTLRFEKQSEEDLNNVKKEYLDLINDILQN